MLCPAAVSAALWLLAVLVGPGLSVPAEDDSGFTLCKHSFYGQIPPRGASGGPPLSQLCRTLPGGRAFATLTRPTCDTAVYSAFHLSHGWTEREEEEEEEGGEQVVEEGVAVPVLLRRGGDSSPEISPTDSPLQLWDSTVTALVRSSIGPQCDSSGGDIYILTGAGGFGAAEEGDEGCQTRPLWSAVCCTVPEGKGGFSLAVIREEEEGERQLSVKELEETLGVEELFSEGCGGEEEGAAVFTLNLYNQDLLENVKKAKADDSDVETDDTDPDSEESNEKVQERRIASVTEDQVANDADDESEKLDDAEDNGETSSDSSTSEGSSDKSHGKKLPRGVRRESSESSSETVDEEETDTNSSSTVVYVLSTTMSILKAPLRPIFNRITQFPGQVVYVLQEDLGVLSTLPGDTFNVFYFLTSDLLSWVRSGAETALGVGENSVSSAYHCSSSMAGALLDSCYTGVTGVGTLAGDTLGIFGGALDNAWWVTKLFGGRLWDQSEGYVGSVAWEMGGQAQAVGGGLGRLAWSSGSTVWKVVRLVGGVIYGILDIFFGGVGEIFGRDSE